MEQLSGEGQFTVSAPSDKAMDKLEINIMECAESGSGCVADNPKNHFLPNIISSGIIEGKAKTYSM